MLLHPLAAAALLVSAVPAQKAGSPVLAKLIADDWNHELHESPTYASIIGDRRWNGRWDDLSAEAIAARRKHDGELVKKLDALLAGKLSAGDRLNAELLRRDHLLWAEAHDLGWHLVAVSPQAGLPEGLRQLPGVQAAYELAGQLRFETVADHEEWLQRLESFGVYVDQTVALLKEGVARGMVPAKVVLQRIPAQVDRQLAEPPERSGWYEPFVHMPASVPPADQARLSKAAAAAVSDVVRPALARFRAFLADVYIPAAPEAVGIGRWKDGEKLYAYWARRSTTTDLSPETLHQLGLSEVARIRGEMERVKASTGFKGTLAEFFTFLRKDPRFYEPTPEALLRHYRDLAKRIDPTLVKLFRTLPRMPYGVEPTPAAMAPDATTGFYFQGAMDGSRAGTYLVNLYRPETRPTWEMVPLTLHEAVPGHHLQTALGFEAPGLPEFRRYGYHMAFGEGWALYCETLGYELGLYEDPYDAFGQLAYEMWRAVRLVVDTGMHLEGWTRERALAYFLENSPRQELDATNEIDRYIATPGQALAYKVGQLKIRELRTRAERALGARFDVRGFHDEVLLAGTLPLDVLERRIDAWISSELHHK
ncbi:MAG: DUF885 domain-containing protein [Anaeromyxobacter sp.]